MGEGRREVKLSQSKVKKFLEESIQAAPDYEDDRVGEMMGLGVNMEIGNRLADTIQVTPMTQDFDKREGAREAT